jgi:CBS domain-containing protein
MQCLQVMKHDFEYVTPDDNVHTAARKMRDRGVGFLPVCNPDRRPVGALTDRDIAVRVAAEDARPSNVGVREVMTTEVVTCSPNDDLRVAEERMAESRKCRIMCVDDEGKLVGVISLSDVMERETDDRLAAYAMRLIARRETRPTVV